MWVRHALAALASVIAFLPAAVRTALGIVLGFVAGSVLRIRRSHVEHAMARADVPSPSRTAAAFYASLGRSAIEFLVFVAGKGRALPVVVEPSSEVRLEELRARGGSFVLAASHSGNWDLAAVAVASRVDLTVVTKHLRVSGLDAFWQESRARRGVKLVPAAGASKAVAAALGRGGAVALMVDQVPDGAATSVRTRFLGADVDVDRAPAALAARHRVPLVVSAARRRSDGVTELSILDVLEPPVSGREAWIAHASRRATAALEAFVLAHPTEWLWLHRRWRAPRGLRPVRGARRADGGSLSVVT
ncbi:MAG: lysophospholipid acyltransferase family protein [Polyangiaceae bacterium]